MRYWCRCRCGNIALVLAGSLVAGRTKSCGCLYREMITAGLNVKHGHKRVKAVSREYRAWCNAKNRCNSPSNIEYHRYGGRGIKMSMAWSKSFAQFLKDMGPCPDGLTLDRINLDGAYEKGNCRWITQQEQMNNMSRNIHIRCLDGVTRTIADLARHSGINYEVLRYCYHSKGEAAAAALAANTLNCRQVR